MRTVKKQYESRLSPEVERQELLNLKVRLQCTEDEYIKCKERLDQVSDSKYAAQLRERAMLLESNAKRLEKYKRRFEIRQKKKELIDSKLRELQPEILKEINSLEEQIYQTDEELKRVEAKVKAQSNSPRDQLQKLIVIKEGWKDLLEEARRLADNRNEDNKVQNKYKELLAIKNGLTKTNNLLKTRYIITCSEYKQKTLQLKYQIAKLTESLQQKKMYFNISI